MIFTSYKKFKSHHLITENLEQAKRLLKDTYLLNKSVKELDRKVKTDNTGIYLLDPKGEKLKFDTLPTNIQIDARRLAYDKQATEDEIKSLNRTYLQKIREIIGEKLGYAYLFVYLYIVEEVPIEELKIIFSKLTKYEDL